MLQDPDKQVRSLAAHSLGQLGFHEVVDPLLKALNDPESDVAWSAAEALAQIGDPAALQQLKKYLPHMDPELAERFSQRL
jgi:HEAT repeat protein